MFKRIKTLVDRHWLAIIVGWVLLAVGLKFVSPTWDQVALDGDLDYLPQNSTSMQGLRLLEQAFPNENAKSEIVLVFSRNEGQLAAEDRQFALSTAEKLETNLKRIPNSPFVDMWTETTEVIGDMLKAKDGQAVMVVARTTRDMMAIENIPLLRDVQAVVRDARAAAPDGLSIGITGSAMIGGDIQDSVRESVENTHVTTVILVLVALIAIYRAPLLVLVPLATIAVSQSVAMDLTALAAKYFGPEGFIPGSTFKIFTTSKIFVVVILYGAATDYCLFLISRYKEELAEGTEVREAPGKALSNVGNALAGSAFTTILGLSTMIFAEYGKFVYSGPVVGACLFVATLACVTFSPALLRAIGPAVFWPFGIKRMTEQIEANAAALQVGLDRSDDVARGRSDWAAGPTLRLWNFIAQFILRRPGTILFMSAWLALPFVLAGLHVEVTHDFVAELSSDRETIHGTATIRRHFGAGSVAPLIVVAQLPDGNFNAKDGKYTIAYLHAALLEMPNVTDVRSLYQPVGGPLGSSRITKKVASGSPLAQEKFVSQTAPYDGEVTQLTVVINEEPFSKAARDISGDIKERLDRFSQQKNTDKGENAWYGAKFDLVGTTPGLRDLELTTKSDQTRIQICTMIAVYLVLLVIIRKPLACTYLMVTVLLSYWVTIGMTELFFTWYYDFVGVPYHGIDWKVPVFLFVILIAVGQDYNIYLTTRVVEEQAKLGQRKGLWRAIVQTGGIITSCGVIMAGTFVSMMTGTLWGMIELGFALSLGVLLDTFFVRTIVVPCYFALMARWFPDEPVTADVPATAAASDKVMSRVPARHSTTLPEPAR